MTPMTSGFAEALNALLDNVGKDFRNRLEEEDVRWWNEHPTELALALLSVSKVRRRPPVPLHRDFKYPLLLGPESDRRSFEAVGFLDFPAYGYQSDHTYFREPEPSEYSVNRGVMFERTNANGQVVGGEDYPFLCENCVDFPKELKQFCLVMTRGRDKHPDSLCSFRFSGGGDNESDDWWHEEPFGLDEECNRMKLVLRRVRA